MAWAAERAALALLLAAARCVAGECMLTLENAGTAVSGAGGRIDLQGELRDPGGARWHAVAWVLHTAEADAGDGGFRWQRGTDWVAGRIDWRRVADAELQLVYRVDEVGGGFAGWNGSGQSRLRLDGPQAPQEGGQLMLWSAGLGGCAGATR